MQIDLREIKQATQALESSGVCVRLPSSKKMGVIGIDGQEYPAPTFADLVKLFELNRSIISLKGLQGFTHILLTPLAAPLDTLIKCLDVALRRFGGVEEDEQASETNPPFRPKVRVNPNSTTWIWEPVAQQFAQESMVYFPSSYESQHGGVTKAELFHNEAICAIPGWSVGLIEPPTPLPQRDQGLVLAGRPQLENDMSPEDYLDILTRSGYMGVTGWTMEGFLTDFLMPLFTTGKIYHDRTKSNALWMLGNYLPDAVDYARLVPTAGWNSKVGHKLYISGHRTRNSFADWGARTVVRLPKI